MDEDPPPPSRTAQGRTLVRATRQTKATTRLFAEHGDDKARQLPFLGWLGVPPTVIFNMAP